MVIIAWVWWSETLLNNLGNPNRMEIGTLLKWCPSLHSHEKIRKAVSHGHWAGSKQDLGLVSLLLPTEDNDWESGALWDFGLWCN